MHDRETFEDTETIDRYLAAVPGPNTAYPARLRARLVALPAPSPHQPPRLRLRRTAMVSVVGGIALAIVLLIAPFGLRQESPMSPEAALARAIHFIDHPVPYRGSSELSFYANFETHRTFTVWEVRDMTHWRIDIRVLQGPMDHRNEVVVANGQSAVWSGGIDGRVFRYALKPPQMGAVLFSMFQGGLGLLGGLGPSMGQTLKQYLAALNNRQSRTHARFIGEQTVLGREADVIEVWPALWKGNGRCTTSQQCESSETGFGRARLWIDHERGILLRQQLSGIPTSVSDAPHNLLYRVTSLSFGR